MDDAFWPHKSRFLRQKKGTAKGEQVCRKDAGGKEEIKRKFGESNSTSNLQYC